MICAGCGKSISVQDALCPHCGRFVLEDRSPNANVRRASAQGSDTWVVVAVVLGLVGLFVAAGFGAMRSRQREATLYVAKSGARTIQPIAEQWVVNHPGACPTMQLLRDEKEISRSVRTDDPWGQAYVVECNGHDRAVLVRSSGPDRVQGTADDIVIPDR